MSPCLALEGQISKEIFPLVPDTASDQVCVREGRKKKGRREGGMAGGEAGRKEGRQAGQLALL